MTESLSVETSVTRTPELFDIADAKSLRLLFGRWRILRSLQEGEVKQFVKLLKKLIRSSTNEMVEFDEFIRLIQPYNDSGQLNFDETRVLARYVSALLKVSKDDQEELSRLFERFQMRLSCMLQRKIGVALESKFELDDVLSDAYIRAERRWYARPEDSSKYYVWLYGIVYEQFVDMYRRLTTETSGGRVRHARLPDCSAVEIALELYQSQTSASTILQRSEFVSKLKEFLERTLKPADIDIFTMHVLDRLSFAEIAEEISRRSVADNGSEQYCQILASLESRSQGSNLNEADSNKRRTDAIRKRFSRSVEKLASGILVEFPELIEMLPRISKNANESPNKQYED